MMLKIIYIFLFLFVTGSLVAFAPEIKSGKIVPESNRKEKDHIRIVQISDTQLGYSGETFTLDSLYFDLAIRKINSLNPQPDIVVNTGDLVNNPDDPDAWKCYQELVKKINPPYMEIMGNHDGWSENGVMQFRERFQRNDYFSYKVKELHLIALNSYYLKYPEKNPEEALKQKDFLTNELRKSIYKLKVVLIHHPLFIKSPDEEEEYFSIPKEERTWLLKLASENNVKYILSGHYHRNMLHVYNKSLYLVTSGSISKPLGMDDTSFPATRGFRVIDVNLREGTYKQQFIQLKEKELNVVSDTGKSRNSFSFISLGDTHYDLPEHHDMTWVRNTHPADTTQIQQYIKHTQEKLPELFREVHSHIKQENKIAFVVHTGDFTEGLCGSYELSKLQLKDFINFSENYIPVPLYITKGNHDITGVGADSAFKDVIYPFINKNTGKVENSSNYSFRKDNAVFFVYDVYHPSSLQWIIKEMEKNKEVQYKIVFMHEPVVPYNARSKWGVFMKPTQTEEREKLLNLLGENHAIVVTGHLHKHSIIVRRTTSGKFVQLGASSVLKELSQKPEILMEGTDKYNGSLINLEPSFSVHDKLERAEILQREKPFVEYFEYADISGYCIFEVADKVIVNLYAGTGNNKWRTVVLTDFLN